jgi:hypothetical protein
MNMVISIFDDHEYYDRAWCALEVAVIQTLGQSYGKHQWYEYRPSPEPAENPRCNKEWRLWKGNFNAKSTGNITDKKLSVDDDRPKITFLERQIKLLKFH